MLTSDVATANSYYHDVTIGISCITVSAMPNFPSQEMVNFCVNWKGSQYYEELNALSQVNGA
jgi:hypothetical protein